MVVKEQTELARTEDKTELAILRVVSATLKEGRELCKHSLETAAQLIGISADDLRALEGDYSVYSIPLWLIHRAAQIYDVSVDYLFGMNADWENCAEVRLERDFSIHLQKIFLQEQAKAAARLVEQNNKITTLTNVVTELAPSIKEIYGAIMRFWELNPQFDEMVAGAPVISRLDRAEKAANEAACLLVRHGFLLPEALNSYPIEEPKTTSGLKNEQKA
ncbi:MAG: helix-turn-helix domain-containing protein [Bacteroidia bacterium]